MNQPQQEQQQQQHHAPSSQMQLFLDGSIDQIMKLLQGIRTTCYAHEEAIKKLQDAQDTTSTTIAQHDQRLSTVEETLANACERHDASLSDLQQQVNALKRILLTGTHPATTNKHTPDASSYATIAASPPDAPTANTAQPTPTPVDLAAEHGSLAAYRQRRRTLNVILHVPADRIQGQPSTYSPAEVEKEFAEARPRLRSAWELPPIGRNCFKIEPVLTKDGVHVHYKSVTQASANSPDDHPMDMPTETTHYMYRLTFTDITYVRALLEHYAPSMAFHQGIRIRHDLIPQLSKQRLLYNTSIYPRAKKLGVSYSLALNGVHPAFRHPFSKMYTQMRSLLDAHAYLDRVEHELQQDNDPSQHADGDDNGATDESSGRASKHPRLETATPPNAGPSTNAQTPCASTPMSQGGHVDPSRPDEQNVDGNPKA